MTSNKSSVQLATLQIIILFQMFNLVRKVVGGPKNRLVTEEFDLDLTYITERIIAMAFPASGL